MARGQRWCWCWCMGLWFGGRGRPVQPVLTGGVSPEPSPPDVSESAQGGCIVVREETPTAPGRMHALRLLPRPPPLHRCCGVDRRDGVQQYYIDAELVERSHTITRNGKHVGTLHGRMIPQEPSYLILNIDLSTRWGWPSCRESPTCNCCNDCTDPACLECYPAFPNGTADTSVNFKQWLVDLCKDLPAYYEIDYVRAYQRSGARRVGCSPRDYPTQGWIESHRDRYTLPYLHEPLRPVLAGGAACAGDRECGGAARGACVAAACQCKGDWTGPKCLVPRAGASRTCRALEDAAIGGGHCRTDAPGACGAARGRGRCVRVAVSEYIPRARSLMADGTWEALGGGDGRCGCAEGWGGAHCGVPLRKGVCPPAPPLDASRTGAQLEAEVEALCRWVDGTKDTAGLAQACDEVLWRPHWEGGGGYAQCGAWLRLNWVATANCIDLQTKTLTPTATGTPAAMEEPAGEGGGGAGGVARPLLLWVTLASGGGMLLLMLVSQFVCAVKDRRLDNFAEAHRSSVTLMRALTSEEDSAGPVTGVAVAGGDKLDGHALGSGLSLAEFEFGQKAVDTMPPSPERGASPLAATTPRSMPNSPLGFTPPPDGSPYNSSCSPPSNPLELQDPIP